MYNQKTIEALMKYTGRSESYVKSFLDYNSRESVGYIGKYEGTTVYSCSRNDYLTHKDEYDEPHSWYWLIMNDRLIVREGKIIGKLKPYSNDVEKCDPAISTDKFYGQGCVVYEDENVRVIQKC